MFELFKKSSGKAGLPPGTLVHVGEKREAPVRISIIDYNAGEIEEKQDATIEDCIRVRQKPTITWINVSGIHNLQIIEELGKGFDLHPLLLEDVVHAGQRPKVEDFEAHLFIVLKMLNAGEDNQGTSAEQVSLVLGPDFVISFQETEGDVFDPIRERLRKGKGRIRKMGSAYLAYALMDAIVDNYFIILEETGERIEALQERVLSDPTPETLGIIHRIKREMLFLRKSVWPLREAVSVLERGESPLIKKSVKVYLRDVYDHTIQVIDTVETFRDMVSGTLDVYLSSVSNKMNQVMKVLTIIATIFIPLTFIAGVYGMNFKYMPELEWRWAYPLVWLVMVILGVIMLWEFKKKKWL
jgi:magnesium transporter